MFRQVLENNFGDFRNEGYEFDYIEEMDIITLVDERDRTYQFYMKHNMCALEWMINKKLNKNKALIEKFPRDCRYPINRKYQN